MSLDKDIIIGNDISFANMDIFQESNPVGNTLIQNNDTVLIEEYPYEDEIKQDMPEDMLDKINDGELINDEIEENNNEYINNNEIDSKSEKIMSDLINKNSRKIKKISENDSVQKYQNNQVNNINIDIDIDNDQNKNDIDNIDNINNFSENIVHIENVPRKRHGLPKTLLVNQQKYQDKQMNNINNENDDENDDKNDHNNEQNKNNTDIFSENIIHTESVPRKKRELPKTLLTNQQKYQNKQMNNIDNENVQIDRNDYNHEYEYEHEQNKNNMDNMDNMDNFSGNIVHIESAPRKKHGLPKTLLANQKKYFEAQERQQKILNNRKDKKKMQFTKKNNILDQQQHQHQLKKQPMIPNADMRRVIVAGKVKYLPIKKENTNIFSSKSGELSDSDKLKNFLNGDITNITNNTNNKDENEKEMPIFKKNKKIITKDKKNIPSTINYQSDSEINKSNIGESNDEIIKNDNFIAKTPKKIPSVIAKKMEQYKATIVKQNSILNKKNKMSSSKKVPSKYAKQIEKDVKKQTVKNIRNFSDLRKIRALHDIKPDTEIDANKASIIELRKLRMEQRKKEQQELKKKSEMNKKDNAIQEILKNDKMSKFAKAVAIKNLSVNSRNRKNNYNKQKNQTKS